MWSRRLNRTYHHRWECVPSYHVLRNSSSKGFQHNGPTAATAARVRQSLLFATKSSQLPLRPPFPSSSHQSSHFSVSTFPHDITSRRYSHDVLDSGKDPLLREAGPQEEDNIILAAETQATNEEEEDDAARIIIIMTAQHMQQLVEASDAAISDNNNNNQNHPKIDTSNTTRQERIKHIESLLEEWNNFLPLLLSTTSSARSTKTTTTTTMEAPLNSMQKLYQIWIDAHNGESLLHGVTPPSHDGVFQIMLKLYSRHAPNGSEALRVLEAWDEVFGTHMEFAPQRRDYEALLRAFCSWQHGSNNDKDVVASSSSTKEARRAAGVAMEVMELLEEWSFTMKPVLETYLLGLQCLSQGILHGDVSNENDTEEKYKACLAKWLQHVVELSSARTKSSQSSTEEDMNLLIAVGLGHALRAVIHLEQDTKVVDWAIIKSAIDYWATNLSHANDKTKQNEMFINGVTAGADAILHLYNRHLTGKQCAIGVEQVLVTMEDLALEALPSNQHYFRAIQTLNGAMDDARDARKSVSDLLNRMEEKHDNRDNALAPEKINLDVEDWNLLMMAYCEAMQPWRALGVWKRMISSKRVRRNDKSFNIAFEACAASGRLEWAKHADSILRKMLSTEPSNRYVEPCAKHFELVMQSWINCGHHSAAVKCEDIFGLMKILSAKDSSLSPDITHYQAMITAWGRCKERVGVEKIKDVIEEATNSGMELDAEIHAGVLSSLRHCHSSDAARQAEILLARLEQQSGPLDLRSYVATMYAWANSGAEEAPLRCEYIFNRLKVLSGRDPSMRPDAAAYRAFLQAWEKSRKLDAGSRAMCILDDMEADSNAGLCESPTTRFYNMAINAYRLSNMAGAEKEAQAIVARMEKGVDEGNTLIQPNAETMTFLIQVWAKSTVSNKASIAFGIFEDMLDKFENGNLQMRPNAYTVTGVLHACMFISPHVDVSVKNEAAQIAMKTFAAADGQFDQRGRSMVNDVTFSYLIGVFGRQTEDIEERTRLTSAVFQRCCEGGYVSALVVHALKEHVPRMHDLLPSDLHGNLDLPPKWTRSLAA